MLLKYFFSDFSEFLKNAQWNNQKVDGTFLHCITMGIKCNQTAISRGQKSLITQQKIKKTGKQISEGHVRMHFYLCLHEEAQEEPLKSFRWYHCCIPHYWLWDLAQSGRIPSHITVQRLGLMFKKNLNHPSELINHVCQEEEIRRPTVYAKRPIKFYTQYSKMNWKWVLRKSRCWVAAEMCQFDLEGFKALNTSSPSDSQEKVFHPCVCWAVTSSKNTHCPSSVHWGTMNTRQKVAGHTEAAVSLFWLFVWGESSSSYTNTDIHVEWQACVCVIDGCRLSTNDTLSESQQDSHRTPGPSVLPISVNTN